MTDPEKEMDLGEEQDAGQTDEEKSQMNSHELGGETTFSQTETEEAPKPRRRRKTAPVESQSDTKHVDVPTDGSSGAKRTAQPVSIDAERTVETDEEKEKNDLLDLLESLKTGKILTGTIQGVERPSDANAHTVAVIYHGAYKILIPAEEALESPADYRDQNPDDVHHYLLTKRLGAEVDYIVKGVDPEAYLAVASRLAAMRVKRKQYYFGTDRDGNNLLYPGVCAEARVISVIRAGIFIDLFDHLLIFL